MAIVQLHDLAPSILAKQSAVPSGGYLRVFPDSVEKREIS
jgi:hypothetical protein